jgi:hypothetical protein
LRPYLGELAEGGHVIVKTAVLDERPGLAVRAPLCNGALAQGEKVPFAGCERNMAVQEVASRSDSPAAPDCRSFDTVAPDVYVAWWAGHGARVGQRHGDSIVWADGSTEAIPPFASRFEDPPSAG